MRHAYVVQWTHLQCVNCSCLVVRLVKTLGVKETSCTENCFKLKEKNALDTIALHNK